MKGNMEGGLGRHKGRDVRWEKGREGGREQLGTDIELQRETKKSRVGGEGRRGERES